MNERVFAIIIKGNECNSHNFLGSFFLAVSCIMSIKFSYGGRDCQPCYFSTFALLSFSSIVTIDNSHYCLAFYLHKVGSKSHSSNQISEILKRIDNNQKEHSFKAVDLSWKVTEKLISANKMW